LWTAFLLPSNGQCEQQFVQACVTSPPSIIFTVGNNLSHMENTTSFETIRPYYDDEVQPVIQQLLSYPTFKGLLHRFFGENTETLIEELKDVKKAIEFQGKVIYPPINMMLSTQSQGLTSSGFDQLEKNGSYLFLSNHRDIVLDSALLNYLLFERGFNTTEIAIGNNLLIEPWIADLVRLNKSFIVHRNLQGRQQLEYSKQLSTYIRTTLTERNQSVWLAQRQGRTKDGHDLTQASLLKMLNMSGEGHLLDNMANLNIVPLSISYEYDPCGSRKLWETEPEFQDITEEQDRQIDIDNMVQGFQGYKGRIHFAAGKPLLRKDLENLENAANKKEQVQELASMIDQSIYANYQLYPINLYAWDKTKGEQRFKKDYTEKDVQQFEAYFKEQLDAVPTTAADLYPKLLAAFAAPVTNHFGL